VDVSDAALGMLAAEAARRGLLDLISLVHADLAAWHPLPGGYAVVLCTGYWDRDLFPAAANAVAEAGLLGWEAFTTGARRARPHLPAAWCLGTGEPASLLPAPFEILSQHDLPDDQAGTKRRLLAQRTAITDHAPLSRPVVAECAVAATDMVGLDPHRASDSLT
jgi:hypothetical protein